ncbi:unnamed protein product, partial [Linum tenue]
VQRKLNLVKQDENKEAKTLKSLDRQPKYHPSDRKSPTSTLKGRAGGVANSDLADKFGSMNMGPRKHQTMGPSSTRAPSMKTGGQWNGGSSDMFLRLATKLQSGRSMTRKVVG